MAKYKGEDKLLNPDGLEVKPVEEILSSLNGSHYLIPGQPNFMSNEYALSLTEDSKQLFADGCPGQGYVGIVDLENGSIHLLPSFNLADGLLRENKHGQPFAQCIESRGQLGGLGDLHSKACFEHNLVAKSGTGKGILGFGVWKSGAGIKLVQQQPEPAGLVPDEYLLIKKDQGHRLVYVEQDRKVREIPLAQVFSHENLSYLQENTGHPQEGTRRQLEKDIRAFHQAQRPNDNLVSIKYAKNRSTSQNVYSIAYTEEFTEWFRCMSAGHTVHVENIKRELPREVFQKIVYAISHDLSMHPLDVLESNSIPSGVDGIKNHLTTEECWESDKLQSILEYGFFTLNKPIVEMALRNPHAYIPYKFEPIIRYCFERKDSEVLDFLALHIQDVHEGLYCILLSAQTFTEPTYLDFASSSIEILVKRGADKEKALLKLQLEKQRALKNMFDFYLFDGDKEGVFNCLKAGIDLNNFDKEKAAIVTHRILNFSDDAILQMLESVKFDFLQLTINVLISFKLPSRVDLLSKLLEKAKQVEENPGLARYLNHFDILQVAISRDWPPNAIALLLQYGAGADKASKQIKAPLALALDEALGLAKFEILHMLLAKNLSVHWLSKLSNLQLMTILMHLVYLDNASNMVISILDALSSHIMNDLNKSQLLLEAIKSKNSAVAMHLINAHLHAEVPYNAICLAIEAEQAEILNCILQKSSMKAIERVITDIINLSHTDAYENALKPLVTCLFANPLGSPENKTVLLLLKLGSPEIKTLVWEKLGNAYPFKIPLLSLACFYMMVNSPQKPFSNKDEANFEDLKRQITAAYAIYANMQKKPGSYVGRLFSAQDPYLSHALQSLDEAINNEITASRLTNPKPINAAKLFTLLNAFISITNVHKTENFYHATKMSVSDKKKIDQLVSCALNVSTATGLMPEALDFSKLADRLSAKKYLKPIVCALLCLAGIAIVSLAVVSLFASCGTTAPLVVALAAIQVHVSAAAITAAIGISSVTTVSAGLATGAATLGIFASGIASTAATFTAGRKALAIFYQPQTYTCVKEVIKIKNIDTCNNIDKMNSPC